jgi:hypothetical protein
VSVNYSPPSGGGLGQVTLSGVPELGQVPQAVSSTEAQWETPSASTVGYTVANGLVTLTP